MTVFFTEPFDTTTAWTTPGTLVAARTGTGMSLTGTTNSSHTLAAGDQSVHLTVDFWVNISTLANARSLLTFRNAGTAQTGLRVETTGAVTVTQGSPTSAVIGTSATGVVTTTGYHHIRFEASQGLTNGSAIVTVNGTIVLNLTNVQTAIGGSPGLYDEVQLYSSSAGTHIFDDLTLENGPENRNTRQSVRVLIAPAPKAQDARQSIRVLIDPVMKAVNSRQSLRVAFSSSSLPPPVVPPAGSQEGSGPPWWPEGFTNPAFTVQRQIYGPALGGDYVRGSSTPSQWMVQTLPSTVLRFQTTSDASAAAVQGKAVLVTRPVDYTSAEIVWGWPKQIQEKWTHVALVRSGFGSPITVNDGQTVFFATKDVFISMEHDALVPGPSVIDTPLQSGQWYYYSLFFKTSPLDWVLGMTSSVVIPRDYSHADHLWNTIPPFYQYTDSNIREGNGFLRNFLKIFGFELDVMREYVEQWQEVYHVDKSPMALLRHVGANFGLAYQQGIGDIRRRALIAGLPLMLQMRGTPIALKQSIVASKYDCDITGGTNLMLLPDDSDFSGGTGNWASLHAVTDALIPTISTYADGNLYDEGGEGLIDEPLVDGLVVEGPYPKALFTTNVVLPPAGQGRGTMRVSSLNKTDETVDLAIACGDGVIDGRTISPLYAGVPVEPGWQYGFSVQIKEPYPCTTNVFLLWFGVGGKPSDYISLSSVTALPPPGDTNWHTYSVSGAAPLNAVYVVPVIAFTSRPTTSDPGGAYYDIAGASVYLLGQDNVVVVAAPDVYLTLGDPSDKIGDAQDPSAPGGFIEKVLGNPP